MRVPQPVATLTSGFRLERRISSLQGHPVFREPIREESSVTVVLETPGSRSDLDVSNVQRRRGGEMTTILIVRRTYLAKLTSPDSYSISQRAILIARDQLPGEFGSATLR